MSKQNGPSSQRFSVNESGRFGSICAETDPVAAAEAEIDRLVDLFNSQPTWGYRQPIERLQVLLGFRLRGLLTLSEATIPAAIVERFDVRSFPERSRGGGAAHECIKAIVAAYLAEVIGCKTVDDEVTGWGGRVDLAGEQPNIVAEIGNTEYSRAEYVLAASKRGRFLLVPFPREAGAPVVTVEFVMSPRGRVELRREARARRKRSALTGNSDISKDGEFAK